MCVWAEAEGDACGKAFRWRVALPCDQQEISEQRDRGASGRGEDLACASPTRILGFSGLKGRASFPVVRRP